MDIAVADESPLGRYLAEIDGATGAESLAALLQSELPRPSSSPTPAAANERLHVPGAVTQRLKRRCSLCGWLCAMRAHAEELVARWLVANLALLVDADTLREELDELSASDLRARRWWIFSSAYFATPSHVFPFAAVCVLSAAAAGWRRAAWRATAVAVVGVMVIELIYQLLLLRHWVNARQLHAAINQYADTKQAFEKSYALSLDLVKKAELASRGYRIGLLLPPVGRIERAANMKCAQLRLRLRRINDSMEKASSRLKKREPLTEFGIQELFTEADAADQRAPSLLISALSKRHELANVLLESVLHTSLFECVSPYWNLVQGDAEDSTKQDSSRSRASQVIAFEALRLQFEELATLFSAWNREFDQLNNSRSVKMLCGNSVESDRVGDQTASGGLPHQESAGEPDKDIEALSGHLNELRTACETLKHLVFAAQHDMSVALESSTPLSLHKAQLSQSLTETRGLMQNMVESLNEAWAQYQNAFDTLSTTDKSNTGPAECEHGEIAEDADEDDATAALRKRSEEARVRENHEKSKFTFVFTGTSTGEPDFDLKALRELQDQHEAPRFFVRELQDVLAHRETYTSPSLTKQIDHDPPAVPAPRVEPETSSVECGGLRSTVTTAMVPSADSVTLQSELQSLLFRRVRAASEEFGD